MTYTIVSFGRESNNHIQKPNKKVSENHGYLKIDALDNITYTDQSTNGTLIGSGNNARWVRHATVNVRRGEQILFSGEVPLDWSQVPMLPPNKPDIKHVVMIGRNEDNDIQYSDNRVSRRHATIKVDKNNKIYIYDESVHGTKVNNMTIRRWQEREIKRGDDVEFGGVQKLDWLQIPNVGESKRLALRLALIFIPIILGILAYFFWPTTVDSTEICNRENSVGNVIFRFYGKMALNSGGNIYISPEPPYISRNKDQLIPFIFTGTGFGVGDKKDGFIVTCNHVVNISPKQLNEIISNSVPQKTAIKWFQTNIGERIDIISNPPNDVELDILDYSILPGRTNYNTSELKSDKLLSKFIKMEIEDNDASHDFAILKIKESNRRNQIQYLPISNIIKKNDEIQSGELVTFLGYPFTSYIRLKNGSGMDDNYSATPTCSSNGTIQQVDESNNEVKLSQEVISGYSGSPVFNKQGKIIGVITKNELYKKDAKTNIAEIAVALRKNLEKLSGSN